MVGLGLAASAGRAAAAPPPDADKLFQRGLREMEAGDFAIACPALEESYKTDPLMGTLFTLAECERLAGKSASAVGHYQDFLDRLGGAPAMERKKHREREGVAMKQRDALKVRAPRLRLSLASPLPAGGHLAIDGKEIEAVALSRPMLIDPGEHVITLVTADGKTQKKLKIAEGEETAIELPMPVPGPAAKEIEAPPPPPPESGGGIPTAAYVTGGIGAAGIVVGAIFGLSALGHKSAVNAGCDVNKICTPDGKQAADALKSNALVSSVGFGVGAVGVAATVVVLLLRSSEPPKTARLVPFAVVGGAGGLVGIERSF